MQLGALEYLISVNSKGVQEGIDKSERMIKSSAGRSEKDLKGYGNKISAWTIAKGQMLAKGLEKSVKMLASTTTNLVKSSVNAFAQFEQLEGGAKLLFGDAYNFIEKRAKTAYKNVQMSTNDYLEQVNGFAVGLRESLNGDSQAAAELADQIITAEADIVAATGKDAQSVQNAFNGIMRGNYMMLDNLGLGLKGSKAGMEEVIKKVNEWHKANKRNTRYSMKSLADQQKALVDFVEMQNLAGYAAREGTNTIQGSIASTKAAWKDLLTSFGNGKDVRGATKRFTDSLRNVIKNVTPVAKTSIKNIISAVKDALPEIKGAIKDVWDDLKKELPQNNIFRKIQEKIEGLMGFFDLLTSLITNFPETMKVLEGSDSTWLRGFGKLLELANLLVDSIEEGIGETDSLLVGTIRGIANFVAQAMQEIANWFEENPEALANIIESIANAIINSADAIFTAIGKVIENPGFTKALSSIVGKIIGLIPKVASSVDNAAGLPEGTTETVAKGYFGFKLLKKLFGGKTGATAASDAAGGGGWIASIGAAIKGLLPSLAVPAAGAGGSLLAFWGISELVNSANRKAEKEREVVADPYRYSKVGGMLGSKLDIIESSVNALLKTTGDTVGMLSPESQLKYFSYNLNKNLFEAFDYTNTSGEKKNKLIDMAYMSNNDAAVAYQMMKWAGFTYDDLRLTKEQRAAFQAAEDAYVTRKKAGGEIGFSEPLTTLNDFFKDSGSYENGKWIIPARIDLTMKDGAESGLQTDLDSYNLSAGVTPYWKKGFGNYTAKGNWSVPYDDYPSLLHRGEMVLTKSQARRYREGGGDVDYMTIGSMIGSSIERAMGKVYVMMSGEKVGDLTTRRIRKNLNANSYKKLRALGG